VKNIFNCSETCQSNADKKRMWFEDLKDINDGKMIDSLPISMIYFKKEQT
jgi:hypothetical protein